MKKTFSDSFFVLYMRMLHIIQKQIVCSLWMADNYMINCAIWTPAIELFRIIKDSKITNGPVGSGLQVPVSDVLTSNFEVTLSSVVK